MLEPLLNSTSIPLLKKVAAFGERRHEILVGNIANIDTPNYRTRDLPVEAFHEALQRAIAARRSGQLTSVSPQAASGEAPLSLEQLFPAELFRGMEAAPQNLTFQDGNNRSIESEVMEMTKNVMMQNMAVELMHAQMGLLQMAISERP